MNPMAEAGESGGNDASSFPKKISVLKKLWYNGKRRKGTEEG